MSEIHSVVRSVLFCSTCSGDIRGSGRRGSNIFPRHWSPHCCCHWRAAIHSVSIMSIAIQRGNATSIKFVFPYCSKIKSVFSYGFINLDSAIVQEFHIIL